MAFRISLGKRHPALTGLCSVAALGVLALGAVLATNPGGSRTSFLLDGGLEGEEASLVRRAAGDAETPDPLQRGLVLPAVLTAVSGDLEGAVPRRYFSLAVGSDDVGLDAEAQAILSRWEGEAREGEDLLDILAEQGVGEAEAEAAAKALRRVYDARRLKAGQQVILTLAPSLEGRLGEEHNRLLDLTLSPSAEVDHQVTRTAAGFVASSIERPLTRHLVYREGSINGSFFGAGKRAGVPFTMLTSLVKAFSYDVDFQRDLRAGDRFELAFEAYVNDRGQVASTGKVIYGALELSGRRKEIYRFTPKSGNSDFFNDKGESVRKALLRTPVDGARISSGFGMRRHPILGYSKMHKGIDFAAPRGTPIFAAGDGVVEIAKWNGGYGRYVRIEHGRGYKTAYAHMTRFARGIRSGKRVRQGQVIGYVGTTGRSTGPHLHYEVLYNNKQINPVKVVQLPGDKLDRADREKFEAMKTEIAEARREGGKIFVANRKTD